MAQIDITHEGKGAFASALGKAQVGDEIIYHIGEYAKGEHKHVAMASHGAGLCVLYQRKERPRRFVYIAKKVAPRKKR